MKLTEYWPTMWIKRTISDYFQSQGQGLELFPAWLVLGPRQIGKSSLLEHHSSGKRHLINLDNLEIRRRANEDPYLLSQSIRLPAIVDEIQYAPQLLSPLKELIDQKKSGPGDIWLTGSQNFEVMQGVRESLAGRVAILNLFGFSDIEKNFSHSNPELFFANILETMFPKLFGVTDHNSRSLYLSSYLSTYVERDIRELLGLEKRREFEIFLKLCAFRSGQLLNYDSIAKDAGIAPATAKHWLSVLADSFLIRIVYPWHSNQNKRLIKTPKIFFLDAGLCAFLSGWFKADQALYSPMAGSLFETHVLSNLYVHLKHQIKNFTMHFWRTKDGDEIDCLLDIDGETIAIEVKMGSVNAKDLLDLKKTKIDRLSQGYVVSLTGSELPHPVTDQWNLISPFGLLKLFN
jgi:predicted AAA+ superfamily ATPase